ncbi:hypothetical protein CBR_g54058 [Chara braunii]|uniref:Uncharacterized protein n=1 Tax=Chara braunii TaxID=69332 RepID=A0A388MBW7_CHABU|nr:hypothetical protein CBR_g54058 [Chara braunii]|eukprot:GBG91962.1 hypothetical protein CBR_g54058 [Chara braunii]
MPMPLPTTSSQPPPSSIAGGDPAAGLSGAGVQGSGAQALIKPEKSSEGQASSAEGSATPKDNAKQGGGILPDLKARLLAKLADAAADGKTGSREEKAKAGRKTPDKKPGSRDENAKKGRSTPGKKPGSGTPDKKGGKGRATPDRSATPDKKAGKGSATPDKKGGKGRGAPDPREEKPLDPKEIVYPEHILQVVDAEAVRDVLLANYLTKEPHTQLRQSEEAKKLLNDVSNETK